MQYVKMREQLISYLKNHEEEQFELLKRMVLQPSYSRDIEDVDKVADIIIDSLKECKLNLEIVDGQGVRGKHLLFKTTACREQKQLLLVGHMDTVFPPKLGFNWYKREAGKVYGPGVIDMKGGLVVAISVIKAFHKLGILHKMPVALLCNSDEETGSKTSVQLIKEEAVKSFAALVFECGGLNGEIVTGRKGRAGYEIEVKGRAGHAAFAGTDKSSAILELAHKIIVLEALNDSEKQFVLNVGVVKGGVGPNTVSEQAKCLVDTRFLTVEDFHNSRAIIEKITFECATPRTSARLHLDSFAAPMEQSSQNRELFQQIKEIADELGLQVREELRSGVSDANTVAISGVPVIDGLGPIGDCDHSDREYMIEKSLLERTLLAALFTVELVKNAGKDFMFSKFSS